MKIGKRIMAVLLYLALVSLLLGFRIKELLDLRQLILVLAGGSLLYLSGMEKGDFTGRKGIDYGLFAMDAVYASLMETFILLFIMLSGGETVKQGENGTPGLLMQNIAKNMRPLFYGICIWIIFGNGQGRRTKGDEKTWTAQESYERFLELGLTRREAEVAVHIGKGLSNKEIAMELSISETTVKKHVSNIFEKLGVEKRQEIRERLTL